MTPRRTASGSSSATSEQIETLMEFLQEHRGLARGYLQGPEARATKNRLWDDITEKPNSLGGAIKTATQWKKVWADKKYLTKRGSAERHKAASRTGGGPPIGPPLTDTDNRVLAVMGEGFGLPQTSVRTPLFLNDENQDIEVEDRVEETVLYGWGGDDEEENITPNQLIDHRYVMTSHLPLRSPTACSSGSNSHTTPALSGTPAVRPPRPTVAPPSVARLASGMPIVCPPRPPTPRTPTVASGTPTVCPPSGRARRPRWRSQNRQVDVRAQLLEGERAKLAELVRIREEMSGVREALTQLVAELKRRS